MASDAFIENQALRQLKASLQLRKLRVAARMRDMNEVLDFLRSQNPRNEPCTSERIGILQEQLAAQDRRHQLLEKLVITVMRFAEAQNTEETLLVLAEVLAVFLGCEAYALLQFDEADQQLRVVGSQGIPDVELRALSADPQAWELIQTNPSADVFIGGNAVAMIPARVRDRIVGLLILHRLLPQRMQLDEEDHELLRTIGVAIGASINELTSAQETSPNAI